MYLATDKVFEWNGTIWVSVGLKLFKAANLAPGQFSPVLPYWGENKIFQKDEKNLQAEYLGEILVNSLFK